MIRLLEHEGKALLARNGVRIPRGALHPDLPQTQGDLVVKAQVLAGARGKAGGIQFASTADEARAFARELSASRIGGAPVKSVYIEERLAIDREYYVCATVDRDQGVPVILASPDGGVEIESVPADRILRLPIDPLDGLGQRELNEVVNFVDPPAAARANVARAVSSLYAALVREDAELVEVNPLALLKDGTIVAADAKCVLDEDALYRHPGRVQEFDGTDFEIAARKLGTMGIELAGNIAAIMNGAGMTMATLDQLIALGGRVGALVELHGAMAHGLERIADIVSLVATLKPRALLVNVFFQFRPLDTIAAGLLLAKERGALPADCKVIVRFRGEMQDKARTMLAGSGFLLTTAFEEACAASVNAAGA